MTYAEKFRYWEMISDYDTGTAQDMIKAERWMYVASVCYSSVSRLIKGLIVYNTHKEAPKSDNLIFLANRLCGNADFSATDNGIRFQSEKDVYFDMLADLTYYHISDYPFSYQKITDRFIDEKTATEVYNNTQTIISWLKSFAPGKDEQ